MLTLDVYIYYAIKDTFMPVFHFEELLHTLHSYKDFDLFETI